ncbi:MAG: hypothetical protein EBT00_02210, partial [Proteobacteria bacterium]|nr:hypothetical protein [Pseudomonadota bacterium]
RTLGVRRGAQAGKGQEGLSRVKLEQLADHLAPVDDGHGAAGVVDEVGRRIDAEDVVDRGVEIEGGDGPVLHSLAPGVGAAHDPPPADSAAGHEGEHGVAPVVAAGRAHGPRRAAVAAVVHARRATELPAEDDHRLLEQAPWRMGDAPADYIEMMLKNIVGIEIEIGALTGKSKLSQNREERDRLNAAQTLELRGQNAMAEAMRKL